MLERIKVHDGTFISAVKYIKKLHSIPNYWDTMQKMFPGVCQYAENLLSVYVIMQKMFPGACQYAGTVHWCMPVCIKYSPVYFCMQKMFPGVC